MRPALFLAALVPAVLADSRPRTHDLTSDLAHRSPAASIPELDIAAREPPVTATPGAATSRLAARHILEARSEGTLGQTPWIGCAIGLTCTALAAVMLG